jgi:hypothetical protein
MHARSNQDVKTIRIIMRNPGPYSVVMLILTSKSTYFVKIISAADVSSLSYDNV